MIREIDEQPAWTGILQLGAIAGTCRVGKVIRRSVWDGTTIMLTVELLTGRVVRVSPDLVQPVPAGNAEDLSIPPIPADAIVVLSTMSRTESLQRQAKAFGATVLDLIEAGFGEVSSAPIPIEPPTPSHRRITRRAIFMRGQSQRTS